MAEELIWHEIPELPPALLERQRDRVHGFQLGSQKMAMARGETGWKAFPARCPHAGGPLQQAWLEEGAVVCPWHRFAFDVTTGECRNAGYGLRLFEVKVEHGKVWVGKPRKKWWQF